MRKAAIVWCALLIANQFPANAAPIYTFPVTGCVVKYVKAHHDYPATDIIAKKGCTVVAATSGVIDFVSPKDLWIGKTNLGKDRGGLSISIVGDDGVRYYGSHLSKIEMGIAVGVRVITGQKIGEVGSTGSAKGTSPHLHFGISWPTSPGDWQIRRGKISPYLYLKAWQDGTDKSPVAAVKKANK